MSITRVGSAIGNGQTVTIPTHAAGDLIVIFAYRDGTNTLPGLPAGWTAITSGGGNTNSMRVGYQIAASSGTTSGTWTSATSVIAVVYRATGTIGIGASAQTGAASTTVTYPALTGMGSNSWVVGFAGHRSTNTNLQNAPTGMTNFLTDVDATDEVAAHDTNAVAASWSATAVSVGGTSSGWRAATVEITEIPPAGASITYTGPARQTLAGTSFTADIGTAAADRIVLVSLAGVPGGGGAPTFSSATINGVSAALIVEGHSDDSHIWFYAVVPTGSGSQTISFTLAQTLFEAVATVYVLSGADTAGITSQYAFDDSFGFQASTSITVTDGGAIFTAASLFTGQSPSFASSTATPNVSASIETAQRGQYAVDLDGLSAGTFTTAQDTNFCFAMSSVAFAAAAPSGPTGTSLNYWNGSAWVSAPLMRWNGTAWVPAQVQRWSGTAWVNV